MRFRSSIVLVGVAMLAACSSLPSTPGNSSGHAIVPLAQRGALSATKPSAANGWGPLKRAANSYHITAADIRAFALQAHLRMLDASKSGSQMYSVVDNDQGGQLGFIYTIKIPSNGVFAGGSFEHKFVKVPQPIPACDPSAKSCNVLYAPTTHLPGQCFEVGSAFFANSAPVQLYVYDICKSKFIFRANLADNVWGPSGVMRPKTGTES
jgi:hypothetical protein